MKDIGSIFPLFGSDLKKTGSQTNIQVEDNTIQYSLCREALLVIAESFPKEEKKVLLPAYTCDTVINPFKQAGWECTYYPVDKTLRIDAEKTLGLYEENPMSLIVVHPYYGMDLNEKELALLNELHGKGCKIVMDLTQCIFSSQNIDFVEYYVGSYRKWYEVPDGGFLKTKKKHDGLKKIIPENEEFVSLQTDSMFLRGLYFEEGNEEVKSISRRLNKMAVEMVEQQIVPHAMASSSIALMKGMDMDRCQKQRFENYQFLYHLLKDMEEIDLVCNDMEAVTTAPLYFPIYVKDRDALQTSMAAEHIYAPVLWPVTIEEVLVNDTIKTIYDTILAIPIDQRYNQGDMDRVVETIKHHYHD